MATFCLLHGAWHDPSCWAGVTERLEALGHGAATPDLPLHDPAAGYAERARPALDALEGIDGPVVVVGHSQSSALAAMVAAARPVSLLVHLCPRMGTFGSPPGAPAPYRESLTFPPNRSDGTKAWDPDAAVEMMYPRLPPETARRLADGLRPMAMPPDDYPLREHPEVPTAFVYAADDEFFEPDFERFMAREVLGIEPIELPGGHFPMAEDPEGLAALLDQLAKVRA